MVGQDGWHDMQDEWLDKMDGRTSWIVRQDGSKDKLDGSIMRYKGGDLTWFHLLAGPLTQTILSMEHREREERRIQVTSNVCTHNQSYPGDKYRIWSDQYCNTHTTNHIG